MTQAGITIRRVFDAARERVWREWTEPERFADWFGGGAEVPLDTVSMDVRPGGAWSLTMLADGGARRIDWHGEYRDVVEPEHLSFTVSDRPGDAFELVTVVLRELGDGQTEMLFQQGGGNLTAEQYQQASQGWAGFFDRVEARLAGG